MNKLGKIITGTTLFLCLIINGLYAQDEKAKVHGKTVVGFEDKNRDGINDRFRDANGDGVNDVTGKAYQHRFKFSDKDEDGVNDLWVDGDGDGVNDWSHKLSKEERRDTDKCVLDLNRDARNDITGLKYKKDAFMGHKFGFIDEATGKVRGKLLDEDGNGIDDRMERSGGHRGRDRFIDEDGDGICDGRGDTLRRQHRSGRKRHGGKSK